MVWNLLLPDMPTKPFPEKPCIVSWDPVMLWELIGPGTCQSQPCRGAEVACHAWESDPTQQSGVDECLYWLMAIRPNHFSPGMLLRGTKREGSHRKKQRSKIPRKHLVASRQWEMFLIGWLKETNIANSLRAHIPGLDSLVGLKTTTSSVTLDNFCS